MTKLVVSFNRHFFAIAFLACVCAFVLILVLDNMIVRWVLGFGIMLAVHFMVASIVASYFIYDASDLYKLRRWPGRCLEIPPKEGLVLHAGFDPASAEIKTKYPQMHLRVLDFFDADKTTEASIQRARLVNPSFDLEEQTAAECWPVDSASQDVVFALSAAHELRKEEERIGFFREARRVLKSGGKVIVIEQLRDVFNFACFGVAAFHFLSRRTWLRSFAGAELALKDEFTLTPFIRVFVLQASI